MRSNKRSRAGAALLSVLLSVFLLCAVLTPIPALAAGGERTIRVGFPVEAGFSEVDENGNLSGYTYEYLREVAQYTGWEYEFVVLNGELNDTLSQSLEMLADGEIDLLGAMNYSPGLAKMYGYPGESYGTAYSVLAVLDSNKAITDSNYAMREALRVAVSEGASARNEQLERFCEASHINAEYIVCADSTEQIEKLHSGEADAVLWVDVSMMDEMRQVARFSPTPFYLATTLGNTNVISKLNRAIAEINRADPYFEVTLHERYFGHTEDGFGLTSEEQAYIKGTDTLRVAVMPDKAPIQDVDPVSGEFYGVAREVFDYIAAQTGLDFQFVLADSSEEMARQLEEGNVDLAACIPYDYGAADLYGVALGRPYLTAQVVMVLGGSVDAADLSGKRLALAKGLTYSGEFMGDVTWYDTVPECIEAVDNGSADYSYGNGYSVQYYADRDQYRNITLVPQSGVMQELCIGVGKPVDGTLLTILNKAVLSIPNSELQAMIYRNAVPESRITLASYVEANPLAAVVAVAAAAALVIGALLIYYRTRLRFSRRMALENERYLQLCELSNEHIYEYDFAKDTLTLTEKSAQALGAPRVRENYLFRLTQDNSAAAERERELFQRLKEEKEACADIRFMMPDGSQRWFRVTGKLICDQDGKPLISIGKLADIQNEKEERDRLMDRAQRDSLTRLYNAAAIRQLVGERLTEQKGHGALLIIDIDHFKQINDQFGHYTGDQVLIALARLLESVFRRGDVIGRLGGDEFIVFMDQVTSLEAVAAKCALLLSETTKLSGLPKGLKATLSVGCAMASGGLDYNQLYQRADKCLYAVKRNGRNGFEIG